MQKNNVLIYNYIDFLNYIGTIMRTSYEVANKLAQNNKSKEETPKKSPTLPKQTTVETPELIQKKRASPFFEDLEKTAVSLSGDICLVLAMEIDDLPTHKSEFRQGMQRAFTKVLFRATQETKRVIVFNDAIPGFILMLFKKNVQSFEESQEWSIDNDENTSESEAASVLAKEYFQRTKHRVVTVESEDALFVFFPVADLKRNLKEMGFYL